MDVRPYEPQDWAAICEVYDLAKPDELRGIVDGSRLLPLDADEKMSELVRASRIFIAEDANRVVGFGGSRECFITWLFVHPAFRRQGIGKTLLGHVMADLTPPIRLNVASANAAARRLYAQIGFRIEREYLGDFQGQPCQVCRLVYDGAA